MHIHADIRNLYIYIYIKIDNLDYILLLTYMAVGKQTNGLESKVLKKRDYGI